MGKKILRVCTLTGLAVVLALVVAGCGQAARKPASQPAVKPAEPANNKRPAEKPAPNPAQAAWQPVGSFSGTGMDNTPKFTVTSNAWRVTITGKSSTPEAAFFTGYLHAKNDDPESPDDYGRIEGRGEGPVSKEFYTKGTYFIHMHVENMEWTVTVEELK